VQMAVVGPDGGCCCGGRLSGGPLRRGDEVVVLPSGVRTRVLTLETPSGPVEVARPGLSLRVALAGNPPVARGDLLARSDSAPAVWAEAVTTVCWLAESPARAGDRFAIKHTTLVTAGEVVAVEATLDLGALRFHPASELVMNAIGRVRWRFERPLAADPYRLSRETGAFIAIDPGSNAPAGAAMLLAGEQQG
jgi:bifunctional enzyme CysN/CysC